MAGERRRLAGARDARDEARGRGAGAPASLKRLGRGGSSSSMVGTVSFTWRKTNAVRRRCRRMLQRKRPAPGTTKAVSFSRVLVELLDLAPSSRMSPEQLLALVLRRRSRRRGSGSRPLIRAVTGRWPVRRMRSDAPSFTIVAEHGPRHRRAWCASPGLGGLGHDPLRVCPPRRSWRSRRAPRAPAARLPGSWATVHEEVRCRPGTGHRRDRVHVLIGRLRPARSRPQPGRAIRRPTHRPSWRATISGRSCQAPAVGGSSSARIVR